MPSMMRSACGSTRSRSRRKRCSRHCDGRRKASLDATVRTTSPTSRGPSRRASPPPGKVETERLCRPQRSERLFWTPPPGEAMALHPVRLLTLLLGVLLTPRPLTIVETGRIAGHVRDSTTGAPIQYAQVVIERTSFGAITDRHGAYSIKNVPVGSYTVIARYIGYRAKQQAGVQLKTNSTVTVDFKLLPTPVMLEGIVVSGARAAPIARQMVGAHALMSAVATDAYAPPGPGVHFDSTEAWRYQRQPGNREQYDEIVENPFIAVAADPLSTFSIDVDRASYSNMRRFIMQDGQLPPRDAVRIEELVNYFPYDYSEPAGDEGIRRAYDEAVANFIRGGNNRVILATDGDFNVGASSDAKMVQLIEEKRRTGVFLTVLGVGEGNLQAAKMEKLADKGNGNYAYLDTITEAQKVLVHELGGTLYTVAKDVKIQVEWNPARVRAYRLIGYENRLLRNEDFTDDKKDAGEVGSGHSVTALYEIVPVGVNTDVTIRMPDSLRYQRRSVQQNSAAGPELLFVKVRYKQPDGDVSRLLSQPVVATAGQAPSTDFQFQAAVAEFGLLLRNSDFRGKADLSRVIAAARDARGSDPDGYRAEFVRLAEAVRGIGLARRDEH